MGRQNERAAIREEVAACKCDFSQAAGAASTLIKVDPGRSNITDPASAQGGAALSLTDVGIAVRRRSAMRRVAHRAGDVPLPVLRALRPAGWTASMMGCTHWWVPSHRATRSTLTCAPAGRGARAGQAGAPQQPCNPYFGSTLPEAYFRPDRRTAKPSRAAAVQGWRAAPPAGLVLDWREHDGSIGRLGASTRTPAAWVPHGRSAVRVCPHLIRSPTRHSRCAPAAGRVRTRRARRL